MNIRQHNLLIRGNIGIRLSDSKMISVPESIDDLSIINFSSNVIETIRYCGFCYYEGILGTKIIKNRKSVIDFDEFEKITE